MTVTGVGSKLSSKIRPDLYSAGLLSPVQTITFEFIIFET